MYVLNIKTFYVSNTVERRNPDSRLASDSQTVRILNEDQNLDAQLAQIWMLIETPIFIVLAKTISG